MRLCIEASPRLEMADERTDKLDECHQGQPRRNNRHYQEILVNMHVPKLSTVPHCFAVELPVEEVCKCRTQY